MGGDAGDSDAAAASGGGGISVNVRCSNGAKFSVRADPGSTVGSFKEAVAASNPDVPADQQRLIYKGRILKDDQTLSSYGVEAEHTIHLVRGATSSALNVPAAGNPGIERATNNALPSAGLGAVGSNAGGDLGDSGIGGLPGLTALGGTAGPFGTGFPDLEQMQQQLTQNPNMMRDMMNTPVIQNLMNNPDLFRNLIMSNPQMREIIDRNPDLAHILNDPGTLRQTLEAARNPELMREMMRNTDRAMSNIEASPEGFNMLRRMYETVHEPLLNATTVAENGGNTLGSNPFAALLGNQGAAVGRDRSVNSSTANSEAIGSPAPNTNPLPNPWSSAGGGGQPNNTVPPPVGNVRLPVIAGLGGAGLPERAMPDASLFNQVLQNPAMTQMMQTLLSNPEYVNQILGSNPDIRNLMESNTQLRQMLQNPEFLRQLASPETLRQIHELQQSIFSIIPQSGQEQNQTSNNASGTPNANLDTLMNMFSGFGTGALGVPATSNVPPEERYATQLSQLQEMGFFDTQENIRALSATAGNVHAAVERLLGNLGQ